MTPSAAPAEFLGTVVGNYKVVSQLGMGGMGAVYLARHVMLGRPAAVKVLLPEMSQNRDVVNRFFNEARAATAIRHPSIVEIYDFGFLPQGNAYIIMEFLEGESLARRIERAGALRADTALVLVRQISGALHAAHEQQIVHRDLKPDNIFVVRDPEIVGGERIKLLDFGIAKLATEAGENKTQMGTVMGTPTYMAPEQCRGAGNVDRRADLYALGCIFYELLCGRPPFVAEGAGDIIAHHLYFAPEPPRRHQPGIPESIEPLVMWLLQKDPAARPASATELIVAIDQHGFSMPHGRASLPTPQPLVVPPPLAKPTTLGGAATAKSSSETVLVRAPNRRGLSLATGGLVLGGGLVWLLVSLPRAEEAPARGALSGPEGQAVATPPAALPVPPSAALPVPPPEVLVAAPMPAPPALGADARTEAPARIKLTIDSEPSGAEVWSGGERVGTTPFVGIEPWSREARSFELRQAGYLDEQLTMTAEVDTARTVTLRRKPAAASSPPRHEASVKRAAPRAAVKPSVPAKPAVIPAPATAASPAKPVSPPAPAKPAAPSPGSNGGVNPFD